MCLNGPLPARRFLSWQHQAMGQKEQDTHRCKTIRFQTQRLVFTQGELLIPGHPGCNAWCQGGNGRGTVTLKD